MSYSYNAFVDYNSGVFVDVLVVVLLEEKELQAVDGVVDQGVGRGIISQGDTVFILCENTHTQLENDNFYHIFVKYLSTELYLGTLVYLLLVCMFHRYVGPSNVMVMQKLFNFSLFPFFSFWSC